MSLGDEILELEEAMWAANRAGDASFYDRVMRDDALAVSSYGVLDRASIVTGIGENRNPYLRSTISEPKVIELTADSVLVTYRADVDAVRDGQPLPLHVLATSVYTRQDGGWRSAFHQQSLLAQPSPPA